jgi:hypothetical protein
MILRGSSLDVSTLFCLKTLKLMWDSAPYNEQYELNHCDHREDWTKDFSQAAVAGKVWLAGDRLESERCKHLLYLAIRGALANASPYFSFSLWYKSTMTRWSNDRDTYQSSISNAIVDMLRIDKDISTYYKGNESLTDCAVTWRCLDIWNSALEKADCRPFSSIIWNSNAHFYAPLGFVSLEGGASVRLTEDITSHKVVLVIDERQSNEGTIPFDKRRMYSRDQELEELTNHWPSILLDHPWVHCEVYPSRPIDVELANHEQNLSPGGGRVKPKSKYNLQPTDDGRIELFIDCCEVGEPWKRLCAEVRRGQGLKDDEYSEDSSSERFEDEYSDSETKEDDDQGGAFTGIFSKVTGVGLDVLSALV